MTAKSLLKKVATIVFFVLALRFTGAGLLHVMGSGSFVALQSVVLVLLGGIGLIVAVDRALAQWSHEREAPPPSRVENETRAADAKPKKRKTVKKHPPRE